MRPREQRAVLSERFWGLIPFKVLKIPGVTIWQLFIIDWKMGGLCSSFPVWGSVCQIWLWVGQKVLFIVADVRSQDLETKSKKYIIATSPRG